MFKECDILYIPVIIIGFVKAGVSNAPWGNDSECPNVTYKAVKTLVLTRILQIKWHITRKTLRDGLDR